MLVDTDMVYSISDKLQGFYLLSVLHLCFFFLISKISSISVYQCRMIKSITGMIVDE